jgi:hypothetical protein
MKSKQLSIPDLQNLRRQFAAWRNTRNHGDRTPEQLWSSAADLARRHGVNPIAKALGLKRRVICPTHKANNVATRTRIKGNPQETDWWARSTWSHFSEQSSDTRNAWRNVISSMIPSRDHAAPALSYKTNLRQQ